MSMLAFAGLRAHSLRRRALWPALACGVVFLGVALSFLDAMVGQLGSQRVASRSRALAHMVASAVEVEPDPGQLRRLVTTLGAEPQIEQIVVTLGNPPRVLAATRSEWTDRTLREVGQGRLADQVGAVVAARSESGATSGRSDRMSYVVPIQREMPSGPAVRGAVAVLVDGSAIRAQIVPWAWRFCGLFLALGGLALLAIEYGLRRYVLKPIEGISDAVRRARAGDRNASSGPHADDEIGRLAVSLEEIHAELNTTIEELAFQKLALDQAALVMVTDPASVVTYVNDAFCRLSGYAREELIGCNPSRVDSGRHPQEFFRVLHETLAAGRIWRGEICNRSRDGGIFWVNSTIIPAMDAAGVPVRYTAILFDITERKHAEAEARAADERFRTVANTAPVFVWITDERGNPTFFNRPFLEFLGQELAQPGVNMWALAVHPDDVGPSRQAFEQAFAEARPFEVEFRVRRHDGEYRTLLSRGVPNRDGGGPDGFIGSSVDITERVASERALRTSEARTRQILDMAIDAVITIDESGRIIDWTRQAEQVFGWTAAEAIGRTLTDTIIPLQYRAAHARGMARFLQSGEAHVLGQRLEITALRRNGEEFPVELSVSALPVEGSMIFSAFARDISDRKRAETELVRARDVAQLASRAKSEFLATMSHEIRTPMNGVIGFTDLLMDTPLDETQREYAETIRLSGQALLALINDILDFSKIEAGKLDVERVPFDARRAAAEVVELLSARAEDHGLELVFEWPADVPGQLVGDSMRFRQVLLNLAGNAIKFTQSGSVSVLADRDPHGQLRVQVRDTGIGIAEEKLGTLFRKFTQADSSTTRRFGGTGLGLAISKQLVELMEGRIGAESRPGAGSTFWFTLPLAADAPVAEPPADAAALAGLRVLVVDDLEAARRVLCSQLGELGVEAVPAANAAEAMVLLHAAAAGGRPFRAALLDHAMPAVDGATLARWVLADPGTGTPALLLMAQGSHRQQAEALRAMGFAEVLFKPVVRPDVLVQALARAAGGWAPGSAAPAPAIALVPAGVTPPEFTGTRVLLAEDAPVNQKLALRILGKLGCAVDLAENGIEACALAAATDYDLILMDCHMPEMDGYEATTAIRKQEAGDQSAGMLARPVPIVALTASVLQEDRDRCFACGMDDFISKPFRPDQIFLALERWARGGGESERPLREAA